MLHARGLRGDDSRAWLPDRPALGWVCRRALWGGPGVDRAVWRVTCDTPHDPWRQRHPAAPPSGGVGVEHGMRSVAPERPYQYRDACVGRRGGGIVVRWYRRGAIC